MTSENDTPEVPRAPPAMQPPQLGEPASPKPLDEAAKAKAKPRKTRTRGPRKPKPLEPTGVAALDDLADAPDVTLNDYARAAGAYVTAAGSLSASAKKAAQIRLSNVLGRVLKRDLEQRLPGIDVVAGERVVSGALRTVNADVSELHAIDGLRLAIEIKPVNLAVGRAIWNRFGDIRTFAVNLHLKFPFAVVGGVLAFPTYEEVGSKASKEAVDDEEDAETILDVGDTENDVLPDAGSGPRRKSTLPLIDRAVKRLVRAGGRLTEGDAPHLLEAIGVVVYEPDTGEVRADVPDQTTGLRWEQFVDRLADAYLGRFEAD